MNMSECNFLHKTSKHMYQYILTILILADSKQNAEFDPMIMLTIKAVAG